MVDEYFVKVKKRMLLRSMELWGIKDVRNIDPILDLLLHTFSHEIADLHQQIDISDTEILDRLSRILVSNKWSLPLPAHALLKAQPEDDITNLETSDHFFCSKRKFGEESLDIFFTPVISKHLINASVEFLAYDNFVIHENQFGEKEIAVNLESKIKDYEVWFGINVSSDLLSKIKELSICVNLKNKMLLPFLKTMDCFDSNGNKLSINKELFSNNSRESHYFDDIISFYEDFFYTLNLEDSSKEMKSINDFFNNPADFFIDSKKLEEKLLWLKIRLPEVFVKEEIQQLDISLNTFPVANRKLTEKQHNFKKNGRILSILTGNSDYFLNIENLIDNLGNDYQNIIQNTSKNLEGNYSLYFGDIGRFDTRSAKMLLSKTFQTVREEGSSFSSVGYDIIQAYLDDLHKKLDEISTKVNLEFKQINTDSNKIFLLTHPHEEAFNYELKYWSTNANQANNIDKTQIISQYKTGKFIEKSIQLKTDTIGGHVRKTEHDKINGLRYGLLTKERIVTREDVKSFINNKIGDFIDYITICDGVTISKESKKGIIRTTDVSIKLKSKLFSEEKQSVFSYYLEKELEKKSISNITYRVFFN